MIRALECTGAAALAVAAVLAARAEIRVRRERRRLVTAAKEHAGREALERAWADERGTAAVAGIEELAESAAALARKITEEGES